MDGIKRKKSIKVKKRTIQNRSFKSNNHRSLLIDSNKIFTTRVRRVRNRKPMRPQRKVVSPKKIRVQKKERKPIYKSLLKKIIIILKKKWFKSLLKMVFIFGIIGLIINNYDQTQITIRPHLEYIDVDELITSKRSPKEHELGFEVIAITDEVSLPILATAKRPVEYLARGSVTVFNDYSSEPQRLLPETRFESASGKIYKLGSEEVIIPGRTTEKPGSTKMVIYAEKPGAEYNIDSTDFSIPGFKEAGLEDKYNKIYASSSLSFSEGFVGTQSFITDEQQIIIENELQEKLHDRLVLKLEKEKTDQLILIKNSIRIDYREPISVFSDSDENGLITERGTIFALAIGKQQLGDYISKNFINKEDVSMIFLNGISINYKGENINFEEQKSININIIGSPLFSWNINPENIKKSILNINKEQLIDIFELTKSIDRAHLKVKPFWRNKVSSIPENITISIEK